MTKKESFHPYFVGTEHGRLSFGTIRKNNEISACMLQSGPDGGRHYVTMDSTGNKEDGMRGSTKAFCPGTLTVKSGKDIENYTVPSTEPNNIPAIWCEAENGDIIIKASRGKIRIEAEDIVLNANGFDGKSGSITLDSNDKINLKSQIIDINASVSTKIFSDKTVEVIGKGLLNIYGGLADFADRTTKNRRSKLSADDSIVSQNEVRNAT
jgi:hypothetical protein|tara:strand:+ start:132 stop:761 length:630 start_codon:yes stop_codon:yes gene_type:complete